MGSRGWAASCIAQEGRYLTVVPVFNTADGAPPNVGAVERGAAVGRHGRPACARAREQRGTVRRLTGGASSRGPPWPLAAQVVRPEAAAAA